MVPKFHILIQQTSLMIITMTTNHYNTKFSFIIYTFILFSSLAYYAAINILAMVNTFHNNSYSKIKQKIKIIWEGCNVYIHL